MTREKVALRYIDDYGECTCVRYSTLSSEVQQIKLVIEKHCLGPLVGISSNYAYGTHASIISIHECKKAFIPLPNGCPEVLLQDLRKRVPISGLIGPIEFLEDCSQKLGVPYDDIVNFPGDKFKLKLLPIAKLPDAFIHDLPPDISYVITTSGTTGRAKLVKVPNTCLMPNIKDLRQEFQVTDNDIILQASPLTFDPSIVEIFLAYQSGATLLVLPEWIKMMPSLLVQTLISNGVTVIQATPSLLESIGGDLLQKTLLSRTSSLRILALGGEKCPLVATLQSWRQPGNKTQFYNIYGITEVSVWSSLACINLESEGSREVPLGQALSTTSLIVKNEKDETITSGEGQLFIGSKVRQCLLDEEQHIDQSKLRPTGDLVMIKDGDIFYRGRLDRQMKRHGKRINLLQIEEVTLLMPNVVQCCVICCSSSTLILIVRLNVDTEGIVDEIRTHLLKHLPSYSIPDDILTRKTLFPVTKHGKLDDKRLLQEWMESKGKTYDGINFLTKSSLCKFIEDILHLDTSMHDFDEMLKDLGVNSIQAVHLLSQLELHHGINAFPYLEQLFQGSLNQFITLILNKFQYKTNVNLVDEPMSKRLRYNTQETDKAMNESKSLQISNPSDLPVVSYMRCSKTIMHGEHKDSKHQITVKPTIDDQRLSTGSLDCKSGMFLEEVWRVNSGKCIDASPLIVKDLDITAAFIGSHSHKFMAVNITKGEILWEQVLDGRIESSACLSACGKFIAVGCYDGMLYLLDRITGAQHWSFQTNDAVKCSPCADPQTGWVIFGSHDQHVYALDVQNKREVWRQNLDAGSIFSSPVISRVPHSVFVATLRGIMFSLDVVSGSVHWSLNLEAPVFSSPAIFRDGICVGDVKGVFTSCDFHGKKLWDYHCEGPIFSSAAVHPTSGEQCQNCLSKSPTISNEIICFASHDKHAYCLHACGRLLWKYAASAEIYSSPYIWEYHQRTITPQHVQGETQRSCDLNVHSGETRNIINRDEKRLIDSEPMTSQSGSKPGELKQLLVVFCSTVGQIHIVSVQNGSLVGDFKCHGEIFSSPVCYEDLIILGCRNDFLIGFRMKGSMNAFAKNGV